ncbi:MAG: hypothetical protein A3I01_03920 [Betaproteobacteria bacterium RIFCSPLOWO2_02_FULL_65_24]|nr:MAG: hypothetical protein A3I01_03920 [Betaproteobacteria bacterium RIFCSPLOWO2_02_FULL_65_24]OGA95753.1 MAG: hypothetical protein A3G27_06895 [Betaproteobacteria bacterium RIFCSPLOWO2_12_FULL_66_14]
MSKQPIPLEQLLVHLPLFKDLSPEKLALVVADGLLEVNAPRGSVLYRRGEPCRGLHIVVWGEVKCTFETRDGGEKVLEVARAGQCLADVVSFVDKPHLVTAEALTDSKLVYMPKAKVLAEMERFPEVARAMVGVLSSRLVDLVSELENCTLRTGKQRVIRYILKHLPQHAAGTQKAVFLPAKKSIIASQLNLTHEHFSRILRDLATAGLIDVRGRQIMISDIATLQARL